MIRVLIPQYKDFCVFEKECKDLYESLQDKICDDNSFEFITQNTFFYLFEMDGVLLGAIYYFYDTNGKLFLNAFAKRKNHRVNLACLRLTTSWFKDDIYALAQNKMSSICLLRCGFKRLKDNLFVKRKAGL